MIGPSSPPPPSPTAGRSLGGESTARPPPRLRRRSPPPRPPPTPIAPRRLAPPRVGAGLRNLGNSCFLNAVLQALTHTPALALAARERLHARSGCVLRDAGRPCACCLLERHVRAALGFDEDRRLEEEDDRDDDDLSGTTRERPGNDSHSYPDQRQNSGRGITPRPHTPSVVAAPPRLPLAPEEVFHNLRFLAKHFVRYRQEDAHELLRLALARMDESCVANRRGASAFDRSANGSPSLDAAATHRVVFDARGVRTDPPTFVERVFQGAFRGRVTCDHCGASSDSYEPFMDASLEISGRDRWDVDSALDAFVAPERLDDPNNLYRCDACDGMRTATRRTSFWECPATLAIHLKRFDVDGGKIIKRVAAPPLRLLPRRPRRARRRRALGPAYELNAVIVHAGSAVDCGHYYAYVRGVRDGGRAPGGESREASEWWEMDDARTRRASEAEVLGDGERGAYVLFYERAEGERAPPHTEGVRAPPPERGVFRAGDGETVADPRRKKTQRAGFGWRGPRANARGRTRSARARTAPPPRAICSAIWTIWTTRLPGGIREAATTEGRRRVARIAIAAEKRETAPGILRGRSRRTPRSGRSTRRGGTRTPPGAGAFPCGSRSRGVGASGSGSGRGRAGTGTRGRGRASDETGVNDATRTA